MLRKRRYNFISVTEFREFGTSWTFSSTVILLHFVLISVYGRTKGVALLEHRLFPSVFAITKKNAYISLTPLNLTFIQ